VKTQIRYEGSVSMDRNKRHLAVKKPILRACYSQDVTPQERRHNMEPIRTNFENPHGWEVPGKGHPAIKGKIH
jgi:hypothetical protein